jgi:hypothetical protein
MGRIARELAINEFTREKSVEKFRRILEQVVCRETAGCRLQVAGRTLQK